MAVPRTYLLTAPAGAQTDQVFGQMIPFRDIVDGLRTVNPRIHVWQQYTPRKWYPGKKLDAPATKKQRAAVRAEGIASLWLGDQPGPPAKLICSLTPGLVPEFTIIGPQGDIIAKGWRAIFEKVVHCGAATRLQLERQFKQSLAIAGIERRLCVQCLRESGDRRPANGGKRNMCNWHDATFEAARRPRPLAG